MAAGKGCLQATPALQLVAGKEVAQNDLNIM